ncbi:MAG: copper-translocating P-type ATPase [Clostridia bacterium]|nr:copper-translocating P-type ATPase [Clostridia bacterium]
MKKIILSIEGMTCSACSNGLEKYLNKQDGIKNASVNLVMANATVEYDEKKINITQIEELVKKAGFKSLGEFKEIRTEKKNVKERVKFIIYTILAILLMYISMGHMINLPSIPFLDIHQNTTNYMVSLLIITLLFILYGWDIIKNGYKNLIHKTPNMDTLVGIGVITSFLYSIYNMYMVIKGNHHQVMNLYFESTSIVIYFIKLGRYIDGRNKDKTKEAIQKLVKITPNVATIKVDGVLKTVTLDEIHKGDIVVCKAGEKAAVDGKIINGKAHFDESFITGESKPVAKEKDSNVLAGSLNYDGYIEYEAEKIGKESTVSEIVKLVIEASNTKAPIAKIADKVSGYFVPVVILIAIITFIMYLIIGKSVETATTTFVTILVVACPCSLGLATPLAIVVSEGLCASNGILVKKSEILEKAQKVNTVVFDKTGTLTYGKLKISEVINYCNIENDNLLQIVGSIENKSTHPIAEAFINHLQEKNIKFLNVDNFENIAGMGVTAGINNEKIIIGNAKILDKFNIINNHVQDEERLSEHGNSILYVAKESELIALIGVNDIVKEEARELIKTLKSRKIETIMLTGDNKKTAEKIAGDLEISKVISEVLPTDKANIIRTLKKEHRVIMMCGDGINDSPALASSDIGVSVNNSTDIAMDSSDVILTKNDLNCIVNLIKISKATIRNIKQNLFWAFFYNCLMIPIAIGLLKPFGISINPMIASLAMVFSSVTVILNALRLRRLK